MRTEAIVALEKMNAEIPSVLDVTYERLRETILSGVLRPGDHLRQELLAQHLGASRGPTREALNRLAAEGLVAFRPRRGYSVTVLNEQDLDEIYELRHILEGQAAYWAAKRRTQDDIDLAEAALIKLEELYVAAPNDLRDWETTHNAFHDAIFQAAGKPRLFKMVRSLRDSIGHYIRFALSKNLVTNGNHRKVFEAFKAGDPELTKKLSEWHIMASQSDICSSLNQEHNRSTTSYD